MRHDCDADGCYGRHDHRTPFVGSTREAHAYEQVRKALVALDSAASILRRDVHGPTVQGMANVTRTIADDLYARLEG
jgi:hypothetical protein